jgi:hypothetical protein
MARKETDYVRKNSPDLAEGYAAQAGAPMLNLYRQGVRDPALMGTLGLFLHDEGRDAEARPCLEAAVAGGVLRPSVTAALAAIRDGNAQADPAPTSPPGRSL